MAIGDAQIDIQAIGWVDDGTEQGHIRTTNIGSLGLVRRAIRLGTSTAAGYSYEASGGATVTNSLRTLRDARYGGHYCTVTCPAANASYVKIQLKAYGRKFGLSWYYVNGQQTAPFTVMIDGRAYPVTFQQVNYLTQAAVSQVDPLLQWVCPDLLDDTAHEIEIVFVGAATAGASRSWILFDLLLDASAGYREQMPTFPMYGPFSVPAGPTGTAFTTGPWDVQNIRIMKLFAYNTSASAARLNVHHGDSAAANIMWSKNIAAYDSEVLDFGPYGNLQAPFYLSAGTGSVINVHILAGQL